MDHDALIQQLRASPLARDLPSDELRRLAEAGTVRSTAEGEVLLEEKQRGNRLVVLLEGEVEVLKSKGNGDWFQVCRLGPGAVLGEVGLILERGGTARVRALTGGRVFELERRAFEELVSAGSRSALAISLALARLLATRLEQTTQQALELCSRIEEEREAHSNRVPADSLIAFRNKLLSEWNF